jgi:hypothetical protein
MILQRTDIPGLFYIPSATVCHAGDVVMDVGANLGLFSIFCSGLVGKKVGHVSSTNRKYSLRLVDIDENAEFLQGRVFAIEPIPEIYAALQFNIATHKTRAEGSGKFTFHIMLR